MVGKVQAFYPDVTSNQIHCARMEMSEIFWKKDHILLLSVELLLMEHEDDHLEALNTAKGATTKALIKSGCTNCFMDLEWAKRVGLEPAPLQNPITMYNVDGMQNRDGKIQFGMDLLVRVGDHQEWIHFLLEKTQSHMVILGHDWLKQHNPEIDWAKAEVKLSCCPKTCSSPPHCHLTPPKVSTLASASIPDTCFSKSGSTPNWPSLYPSVFSEAEWDELPCSRPDFNIKIEFKTDPGHLTSKLYSLMRDEMVEMNCWVDKQLASG